MLLIISHDISIKTRVEMVEEKIEAACRRSGRKREDVRLMGVTKMQPLEKVEAAWDAGIRLFGESRVLEGIDKFVQFRKNNPREGVELHLIGSLQRNKANKAAAVFDCIQSVDRDSLISTLGALTKGRENPIKILLEYHTGEETKAGFADLDSLLRAAEKALSIPGLLLQGLMTMAPYTTDESVIRLSFKKLAAARYELEKRYPLKKECWANLSMGMTNDYEIAIEEGSTMIRIGTAIFGEGGT
jgi:pyridoxal phosphate enzyme (YggS family)